MKQKAFHPEKNKSHQKQQRRNNNSNKPKKTNNQSAENENITLKIKKLPQLIQPGSPHSIFHESYSISLFEKNECTTHSQEESTTVINPTNDNNENDDTNDMKSKSMPQSSQVTLEASNEDTRSSSSRFLCEQIVHTHQNSLCVITAGNSILQPSTFDVSKNDHPTNIDRNANPITKIHYLQQINSSTMGGKNKKRKAMKMKDAVYPSDPLVQIHYQNGHVQTFYCCVYGKLLELNEVRLQQNPNVLLQQDPLMDGYLAIILPFHTFPPL